MPSAPGPVWIFGRRFRQGVLSQVLAGVMTVSLATASSTVQASTTQDSEIERLYVEGQDKYAAGDFAGAADAWTRLLNRLPEGQANRATRENVLLNIVQAHLDGYARARRDDGSKDIGHLRNAKKVLEAYFSGFTQAYGDRAAVSAAVQEKADELDRTLDEAEQEVAALIEPTEPTEPVTPVEPIETNAGEKGRPDVIVLQSSNDGLPLIVGGAVSAGLSLGGFGLLISGGVIGSAATEEFNSATTEDAREVAREKGNTGDALAYSGAVIGPVLLIAGGVLIGFGFKRRHDAKAAAEKQHLRDVSVLPVTGRGYGGLVFQGRF